MTDSENKKRSGLFTGIIVGGAVGSVLSLLFSNKKCRKKGIEMIGEVSKKGKSFFGRFRNHETTKK